MGCPGFGFTNKFKAAVSMTNPPDRVEQKGDAPEAHLNLSIKSAFATLSTGRRVAA